MSEVIAQSNPPPTQAPAWKPFGVGIGCLSFQTPHTQELSPAGHTSQVRTALESIPSVSDMQIERVNGLKVAVHEPSPSSASLTNEFAS